MPRRPRVRLIFEDAAGREWELYEHVIIAGMRHMRSVGEGGADYRTFVPLDGGAPKQYRFFRDSPNGGRSLSPLVLQRQLAEAEEVERKRRGVA
jgi:hypothetical protein